MCGIFGVIFHGDKHVGKQNDIAWAFSMLAQEAAVRGTDATGMARIEGDGYMYMYKNVVPSYEIVNFRRWWRPLGNIGPRTLALFGHTRFGTHGENTIENAHPFLFTGSAGRILGTHNGIISNYLALGPNEPLDNDSAALFYRLAETPKEEWGVLLASVNGSMALAWADGKSVYLARNHGNPCVTAYLEELDATFYASTEDILKNALGKSPFYSTLKMRQLPVGRIFEYVPGSRVAVETGFKTYDYPSAYGGAWYGWGDSDSHYGREYSSKFVPSKDRLVADEVIVCETCGKETPFDECVFSHSIRQYECRKCAYHNSPTRRTRTTCMWCEQEVSVKYDEDTESWLCEVCTDYVHDRYKDIGTRKKADTVECTCCGNEYSVVLLGTQIFDSQTYGGPVCQDCYTNYAESV